MIKQHSVHISDPYNLPKYVSTPLRDCENLACLQLQLFNSVSFEVHRRIYQAYTIGILLIEGTLIGFFFEGGDGGGWRRMWVLIQSNAF